MAIKGKSERRRLAIDMNIPLGVRWTKDRDGQRKVLTRDQNGGFPREVEYFVLSPEHGAGPEVIAAYPEKPRKLRAMLAFEVETIDWQGQEMVLDESNRAYGFSGLRCKGDGGNRGEYAGTAETSDEAWKDRIEQYTGVPAVRLPNGRWRVRCWGTDCVKHLQTGPDNKLVEGKDQDAACKAIHILRFFLIHPTTDPNHPDYLRVLASARITSGSTNTMVDVKSGIDQLRFWSGGETGRTCALPFTLERRSMQTRYNGKTAIHFPIRVTCDTREVQRIAQLPPSLVFTSPEVVREMARMRELGAHVPLQAVTHLLPAHLAEPKTEASAPPEQPPGTFMDRLGAVLNGTDPSEVVDGAQPGAAFQGPDDMPLSGKERDLLKQLAGAHLANPDLPFHQRENPWDDASLDQLRALQRRWHVDHGGSPSDPLKLGSITFAQARWIVSQLRSAADEEAGNGDGEPEGEPPEQEADYREVSDDDQAQAPPPEPTGVETGQPELFGSQRA